MRFKRMLAAVVCVGMALASGCGGAPAEPFGVMVGTPFGVTAPTPEPMILPPRPSETPMVCSANPEGMSLLVTLGEKSAGFQHFTLDGKGFVRGE
jgi:hypothetical protein